MRMPNVVVQSGIPNNVFYNMTGIGTALVMGLAVFYFLKLKPKWEAEFNTGLRQHVSDHNSNETQNK